MKPLETLLLKRGDVTALLSLDECITAVELAFNLYAEGQTLPPGVLGVHARDGGFHIKAAGLKLARTYFAVKVNGNFFRNTERYGMPNIQGIIMLCDGDNGYPLALMDSIEITILRTGAATAVAAKYLARDDAKVATICGCGNQGRIQLKALMKGRTLERVYAFDLDHARAERFAGELSDELGIETQAVRELAPAVRQSDVCVTCTPSRQFFLKRDDVVPGTFIFRIEFCGVRPLKLARISRAAFDRKTSEGGVMMKWITRTGIRVNRTANLLAHPPVSQSGGRVPLRPGGAGRRVAGGEWRHRLRRPRRYLVSQE